MTNTPTYLWVDGQVKAIDSWLDATYLPDGQYQCYDPNYDGIQFGTISVGPNKSILWRDISEEDLLPEFRAMLLLIT